MNSLSFFAMLDDIVWSKRRGDDDERVLMLVWYWHYWEWSQRIQCGRLGHARLSWSLWLVFAGIVHGIVCTLRFRRSLDPQVGRMDLTASTSPTGCFWREMPHEASLEY